MKIGDIVQLKPSYAKWNLEHQDIYVRPNGVQTKSDILEQDTKNFMHIMSCFGVPVLGKVVTHGFDSKTFGILWHVPTTQKYAFYFVTTKHALVVKRK